MNFDLPFEFIQRRWRLCYDVWSKNAALFERLMEIYSNPSILYNGFNQILTCTCFSFFFCGPIFFFLLGTAFLHSHRLLGPVPWSTLVSRSISPLASVSSSSWSCHPHPPLHLHPWAPLLPPPCPPPASARLLKIKSIQCEFTGKWKPRFNPKSLKFKKKNYEPTYMYDTVKYVH